MDKLNTKSIVARVKAETPAFWKKIRNLMIVCGSIGAALEALPEKYTNWMPENTSGMMIVAGVIGASLASMTVKDTKKAEDKIREDK
jgi:hypothetical protein